MSARANRFAIEVLPAARACCQSMNLQDCAAMRAAKSSSRNKIVVPGGTACLVAPKPGEGGRRPKFPRIEICFSISFNVARMFFAGILANHFNPFRQNNSRASGFGAVMTVPSGVSFGARTPSFLWAKPSSKAAFAIFEFPKTSRLKTGTSFRLSRPFAFQASVAPARNIGQLTASGCGCPPSPQSVMR